jgi:hypothetical protein
MQLNTNLMRITVKPDLIVNRWHFAMGQQNSYVSVHQQTYKQDTKSVVGTVSINGSLFGKSFSNTLSS